MLRAQDANDVQMRTSIRRGETRVVNVPTIDIAPLITGDGDAHAVARAIDDACRDTGFFAITGHGVDAELRQRLDALAREFFALPDSEKREIEMARGGRAWRGWFPVGGELTSGIPDQKEGIYFGAELAESETPLHGPNLFPRRPDALRATVLEYLDVLTDLAQSVLRGMALALELPEDWFASNLTAEPTILFRIFRYPPARADADADEWGVREHTDYGLLTILGQDARGGLKVHCSEGWIDVPPNADAFVCNLCDMIERMTGGRYRSTPHRVRNTGENDRLSFPFFFDPSWTADVGRVPELNSATARGDNRPRWDDARVDTLSGTYGNYLLAKVSKVFPSLGTDVL
jgi:isopenicillin N synthase-like dioxygenase